MNSTHHSRLTSAQIAHYQSEGYVLPRIKVFEESKFQRLFEHFETSLARWPKEERPEAMDTPHFSDHRLLEWALAPEVVDLVEPLLGSDILLFSTHFICKPKGDGRRVPWHEDSAYWRRMLEPMEVATVWLAIDPSRKENGCMHVIPRTHNTGRKGFSDYEAVDLSKSVFASEILPSQRKEELAVPCELEANECSLHDARTQHGSAPNTSDLRRCGYTMRFIPASCRLHPDFQSVQLLYLARGRNVLNQTLADPSRDYPEVMELRRQKNLKAH